MNKHRAKHITLTALCIAIVCISTMIIKIPIPLGYMHLGNCCILLVSVFFGRTAGTLAGGVGSALADLLGGFPEWILPTLIIKSIMGFAIAAVARDKNGRMRMASLKTLIASIAGILIMIAGYFAGGSVLYGSIITGAAQIPGLALEGIIGIVLFYVLGFAFEAAKIPELMQTK